MNQGENMRQTTKIDKQKIINCLFINTWKLFPLMLNFLFFTIMIYNSPVTADYKTFLEYRETGRHDEALIEIEKLLQDEPENFDFKLHRGIILSWLNRYDEAKNIFFEIINKKPEYYDAYVCLARVFFWQGRYDEAEKSINEVLMLKPVYQEAEDLRAAIKKAKQSDYNKNVFVENVLSDRGDNKEISTIKKKTGKSLEFFSSLNVLRDYEPELNKYPYKEINFRAGAGYTLYYKKTPLDIYYKTGFIKQLNTNWHDNEYYLTLNSLTLNSGYSTENNYLSCHISLNNYENYGSSYFKISGSNIKVRPFLLASRKVKENYKIYLAYAIEDWYKKNADSRRLIIENLSTISVSNLIVINQDYYSADILRSIYSDESGRNYTDYILQADKLLANALKKELRLILKYKYRDYKNSHLHFYYLKTFYLFNQSNNSKIKCGCSYEFNLIKPYTTTGHKLETNLTYRLNSKINISAYTDFLFYTAKDKDRELKTFLKLEYNY